jgi:hypothetical protein
MIIHWFKNLLPSNQNLLSCGLFAVMVGISLRIAFGSDLALNVADSQLVLSDSADKLAALAQELNTQAEIIREKDKAYQELSRIYEQSLKEAEGYERLKAKIETIDFLPEVENIEIIQTEINNTESDLTEFGYK